jgi:hypothetical protein
MLRAVAKMIWINVSPDYVGNDVMMTASRLPSLLPGRDEHMNDEP